MNYRNGKPIGATILPGKGRKGMKHDDSTVFMTFEELVKTWKSRVKRYDKAGDF